MASAIDEWWGTHDLVSDVFLVDTDTARDLWNIVNKVVRICIKKHVGYEDEKSIAHVKRIITKRLREELDSPSCFNDMEHPSIHTYIVVMSREITLNYIRNAHYYKSTISDIFRAMGVNVAGAEDYLDGLDQIFSPSQKVVLRLMYGEGCTADQAAGMLGVSAAEVRSISWQALERLKEEWQALRDKGGFQ